jgi:hypothetical protein
MASTDILDSANDQAKFASALMGNLTALRFKRRAVSYASDANKTLTSSEYDGSHIDVGSGTTLTATRNLVFPLTDGAEWVVTNEATGAQSIQCIGATGTGVTIATGKSAVIRCDGTNIRRVTADVTP